MNPADVAGRGYARRRGPTDRTLTELENRLRQVPAAWPEPEAAVVEPDYTWVSVLVKGGNRLIPSPTPVYGIKRKAGEAKAGHWIHAPRRCVASAQLGTGGSAGTVVKINRSDVGACYDSASPPTVTLSAPPSGGTQATATASVVDNDAVAGVYVTNCGTLYQSSWTVTFSDPPPGGRRATGQAIMRDGKIVAVRVIDPGEGYAGTATATISASDGGGTQATAVCVMRKGSLIFTITNAGAGYVSPPSVTVAVPPAKPQPPPPFVGDDTPTPWADGVGWGTIEGGSLTGSLAAGLAVLVVHDDRAIVPFGLMGDGGSGVPTARPPDSVLSWYLTTIRLTIADVDADGVLDAWVPMGGGV